MTAELEQKYQCLRAILREMGGVVIGLSGGVDSTLLVKVAHEVLGDRCIAVIGKSEAFPEGEVEEALQLAEQMGVRVRVVPTHELSNPLFRVNRPDRCYHCKTELYSVLRRVADEEGIAWIADGTHADDLGDYRPGLRAAQEFGVRAPLLEAGLSKAEIRALARALGLPIWDKPSFACLSSRFPYGTVITRELLQKVDRAERFLRELGLRQVRVRHHDTLARIEVEPRDFERVLQHAPEIVAHLRSLGYVYVALDLEGYRSGKMNDALQLPEGKRDG
ncbi:MAG: ATP-dependent sacrificial sulfur transferase LarE [Fimbriimonadales bacterium]|nr:ATP-dependent sacrificial sulfur transferase LarE [Fimbriimonadales bacterium]MDW8051689.1 ATP-dependent sacrificial sulfur transferase LarE [Armatimonadota bacterium]